MLPSLLPLQSSLVLSASNLTRPAAPRLDMVGRTIQLCSCCFRWDSPLSDDVIVMCRHDDDAADAVSEQAPLESMLALAAPPTTESPFVESEEILRVSRGAIGDIGDVKGGSCISDFTEAPAQPPPPSPAAVPTAVGLDDGCSARDFLGFRPKVNWLS